MQSNPAIYKKHLKKLLLIIQSCNTKEQVEVSQNFVVFFLHKWKDLVTLDDVKTIEERILQVKIYIYSINKYT